MSEKTEKLTHIEIKRKMKNMVEQSINNVEKTITQKVQRGHDIDVWVSDYEKLKKLKKLLEWYEYTEY